MKSGLKNDMKMSLVPIGQNKKTGQYSIQHVVSSNIELIFINTVLYSHD